MRGTIALLLTLVLLGGCGIPAALQIASFAADGFSLATTGKTTTDHAISSVYDKDCVLLRSLEGDEVCRHREPAVAERTGEP